MYELTWLVEGQVFYARAYGTIPREEVLRVDQEITNYLDQHSAKLVHGIYDLNEADKLPGLRVLGNLRYPRHPAMGFHVMIGQMNPIIEFLVVMTAKIHRSRFQVCDSLESAVAFLKRADDQLRDIPFDVMV